MNFWERVNRSRSLKRVFDIFVSLAMLFVLLFPGIFLLFLCRWMMGPGVFYRQPRVGLKGRIFNIIKLRSMTNTRGLDGELLSDEERLNRFGKFLRASSLDELPELWNVLKGEMSLVGPRPYLVEYLPFYSSEQMRRHDELPGITGWAQIMGRNSVSWPERFRLDLWYVERRNFLLDLKIIFLTVKAVVSRKGISADGHATMPFFVDWKKLRDRGTQQEGEERHG